LPGWRFASCRVPCRFLLVLVVRPFLIVRMFGQFAKRVLGTKTTGNPVERNARRARGVSQRHQYLVSDVSRESSPTAGDLPRFCNMDLVRSQKGEAIMLPEGLCPPGCIFSPPYPIAACRDQTVGRSADSRSPARKSSLAGRPSSNFSAFAAQ